MAPPCVVSVCSVVWGRFFCSVLLVWNLLGGPHESGYIYLLPQSSPLARCSTATTCTIQTRLCSVPIWTEDLWGALWHVNLPLFFFTSGSGGIRTQDLQRERQALYQLSYPATACRDAQRWKNHMNVFRNSLLCNKWRKKINEKILGNIFQ